MVAFVTGTWTGKRTLTDPASLECVIDVRIINDTIGGPANDHELHLSLGIRPMLAALRARMHDFISKRSRYTVFDQILATAVRVDVHHRRCNAIEFA